MRKNKRTLVVVEYDPQWPRRFALIRQSIANALGDVAIAIEHVGSTAVPGLVSKPVIDMSVVVENSLGVSQAIETLARLGYVHRGDLGVQGREAFETPFDAPPHHLYVCPQGSLGLRNHLAIRDYLRANPNVASQYGDLKMDLARRYPNDIDAYVDGKTEFLLKILSDVGLSTSDLESIRQSNRKP